jgi:hypothetical protein
MGFAACLCNTSACKAKGNADLRKDANVLPKVITYDVMVPAAFEHEKRAGSNAIV